MSYQAGDIIDNRYKLIEIIGSGGHGHVFRADDMELGAPVAIKCLLPNIMSEPVFTTRITREARAMGVLSGTSATQILAFNRSDRGVLYIVMELLLGRDLGAYLRELEAQRKQMSVDRALEIMGPVAETLSAAHARNILHRDVKPANIFLLKTSARGRVRLLDFGLAKEIGGSTVTTEGTIAGSPAYVAPEGWAGKPKELDRRVDIYAFGVVVFRMLGHRLPFHAKRLMDLVRVVSTGPRPSLHVLRPDLPEAIDRWCARILAIRPADRHPSIDDAWSELTAVFGREPSVDEHD